MRMSDPSIQDSPSAPLDNARASSLPSPAAATGGRSERSALFIVFLVVVIDLLGFGIVLPLLPIYGRLYVGHLIEPNSHWVGAIVGLLLAIFSLMQFLFAPIWGRVSDRVGRRPILLLGLAGSVAFYALFGYGSDLPETAEWAGLALTLLFIARAGAGVAGATIATAQAVIADCTPPERRKHGMALIGMAFGIGFTFGPLVAVASLYFFPQHKGVVGYFAAGLSLSALILGVVLLPETRRFSEAPPLTRKWFDWNAVRFALRDPAVGPVVWVFFLTTLGFTMFEVTLALLFQDAMTIPLEDNGYLFAYIGFVLALAQGVLYRRLAKRVSEPTFMAVGIVLMGLGMVSLAGVSWAAIQPIEYRLEYRTLFTLLLVGLTVAVTGFALLTPSAQALVSRRSDPEKQGEILGVNQSASAMARIIGPLISLPLYYATPGHLLPYLLGGGLMLLMLALIPRIRKGKDAFTPTAAKME
jgi:MFS transporter, DHA1 family, tetracycline resistance protein